MPLLPTTVETIPVHTCEMYCFFKTNLSQQGGVPFHKLWWLCRAVAWARKRQCTHPESSEKKKQPWVHNRQLANTISPNRASDWATATQRQHKAEARRRADIRYYTGRHLLTKQMLPLEPTVLFFNKAPNLGIPLVSQNQCWSQRACLPPLNSDWTVNIFFDVCA